MGRTDWNSEDVEATLFKCISWQVEETLDPTHCPYHYFCDRTYPLGSNFPPVIDIFVFFFMSASYLATLSIMVIDMVSPRGRVIRFSQSKRYFLPSGPISLPLIILVLAKGHQIDTVFPVSDTGPAILQLVLISALSFDNTEAEKEFTKYVFFAASTISGILHASMYLDLVVLPYYTGLDVLKSSTFSGECVTCVCRKEVLTVGGNIVKYRGLSLATFLVVGVLFLRILCKVIGEKGEKLARVGSVVENLGLFFMTRDCMNLKAKSPREGEMLSGAAFGGILLLICLHFLKRACTTIEICTLFSQSQGRLPIAMQNRRY